MTDKKKPDVTKLLTALLVSFVLFPINSILLVLILRTTWRWYIQPSFGGGPPDSVWFGILLLHMFATYQYKVPRPEEEKQLEAPVAAALTQFFVRWGTVGVTFAVASLTATIMGWK